MCRLEHLSHAFQQFDNRKRNDEKIDTQTNATALEHSMSFLDVVHTQEKKCDELFSSEVTKKTLQEILCDVRCTMPVCQNNDDDVKYY